MVKQKARAVGLMSHHGVSDELFDCKLKEFESGSGRREVDSAKRYAVPGCPNRGEEPESCLWAALEVAGTHVVFGARPLPFITNVPRVILGDGPLDHHLQKRRRSQNLEPCRTGWNCFTSCNVEL